MGLIDRRVHHLAPLGLPVTLNGVSNTIIFKATGQTWPTSTRSWCFEGQPT
jgi:hypothetical protein